MGKDITMEIKIIDFDFSVCKVDNYSLAKMDKEQKT